MSRAPRIAFLVAVVLLVASYGSKLAAENAPVNFVPEMELSYVDPVSGERVSVVDDQAPAA